MKRIRVSIGFVFMFILLAFSPSEFTLINSIPFNPHVFFTTDQLGNVFVVAENQLLEFDASGKPKYNYSENKLGELSWVDASNPMKILLFYPDFAQVILLNNKLAAESNINLRSLGIMQPVLCCNSMFDGYWVYDIQDFQLKKIDLNLQISFQSSDLNRMLGYSVHPNFLVEESGNVYLNDPGHGIIVFDRYGTFYKTIPIEGLQTFQIFQDELLYMKNDTLNGFKLKTLEQRTLVLPERENLLAARFGNAELYLLTKHSLNFYSF